MTSMTSMTSMDGELVASQLALVSDVGESLASAESQFRPTRYSPEAIPQRSIYTSVALCSMSRLPNITSRSLQWRKR